MNEMKNEKKQNKSSGFFKKAMKFVGIFALSIVAIVAVAAVGAAISGQFNPKKIYVQQLSINGQKEYVTITQNDDNYTTKVDFSPADANQLTLTAKILTGADLIEPISSVTAGENFELKFKKDDKGVTKGGEIEIKFIDSAQNAYTTLKVLIDVSLDSKYINVSSNGTELSATDDTQELKTTVLTTVKQESANIIKISADYDEMFNSYKGNWTESDNNSAVNLNKLKKMILKYKDDVKVNNFEVSEVVNDGKYYLIKYLTPQKTEEDFELNVYLYKTYYLETIVNESFANQLINVLETEDVDRGKLDYDKLNDFINTYVYNASSVDVKNNYAVFVDGDTGLIEMDPIKYTRNKTQFMKAIEDTIDYIFARKTILIGVKNIKVTSISNTYVGEEISRPVLKTDTYTITDINTQLGVSLNGDGDTLDSQVLFNALRELDIRLCYLSDESTYKTALEGANLKETIGAINDFYYIGTSYYKRVEDDNSKIRIKKTTLDNGDVNWEIETLSPTANNDKYYLVYAYESNDIEYTNESNKSITIATTTGTGKPTTSTYYLRTDGTGNMGWRTGSKDILPSDSSLSTSNIVTNQEILNRLNGYTYSCSPLKITYTAGTIQYNTTTHNGLNNINNVGTTSIVLNSAGTVYRNDDGSAKVVAHGSEGGVYYKSREFTVAQRKSESEVLKSNVIVKANDLTKDMEYTTVKWFVKYNDNIVNDNPSATLTPASNNKYYLKPTVKTYNNSTTDNNEIPAQCRLMNIADSSYLNGNEFFMEVGQDDFTLGALNALAENTYIRLYAVIVQTDKDHNAVTTTTSDGICTYTYISYTNEHSVGVTQLVENLNAYIQIIDINGQINWQKTITTDDEGQSQYNSVNVITNIHESIYITCFELDSEGNVKESAEDWTDGLDIVMKEAIDVVRNYKLALLKLYNEFIASETGSGKLYGSEKYDAGKEYPAGLTPTIEVKLPDDGTAIQFIISHSDTTIEQSWAYRFKFDISDNNSSGKIFTKVKAYGYFNLCPSTATGGGESST